MFMPAFFQCNRHGTAIRISYNTGCIFIVYFNHLIIYGNVNKLIPFFYNYSSMVCSTIHNRSRCIVCFVLKSAKYKAMLISACAISQRHKCYRISICLFKCSGNRRTSCRHGEGKCSVTIISNFNISCI